MTDRYGTFAPPEERTRIEVVHDPLSLACAIYQAWLPVARHERYVTLKKTLVGPEIPKTLYASAAARIRPQAGALAGINARGLELMLKTLQPCTDDITFDTPGIFLSAILNETSLPKLDGVFRYSYLGYRLAAGKTLIARKGSDVCGLGEDARGIILNYGRVGHFAPGAAAGIQVNYGIVGNDIGQSAEGGIQANYGRARTLAHWATGGIQVNHGRITWEFATDLRGGVQVNHGTARRVGDFSIGGVQYDAARGKFDGSLRWQNARRMRPPMRRLLKRLTPVRMLGRYAKDPDGALAYVQSQDWSALERDARTLADDVRDAGKWSSHKA